MLDALRKRSNGPVAKILIGVLVVGFAAFGLSGKLFSGAGNIVQKVGDQQITADDFTRTYTNVRQYIAGQTYYTMDQARDLTLQSLLQNAVLDNEVSRLRLGISNQALAAQIQADPSFQDPSGVFSRLAFDNVVNGNYGSEQAYLAIRRPDELRGQVQSAVAGSNMKLPSSYAELIHDYQTEQRDVLYITLTNDNLSAVPDPTEDQVNGYYNDNTTKWLAPEIRTVTFFELTPEAIANPDAITPDQIQAAYDQRRDQLGTPETRHVWQQILTADQQTTVQAAIDSGKSFDQMVADGDIAPNDAGVVGLSFFIDPTVGEAAFALPENGMTVASGRFGATFVHVGEINAATVPTLADVTDTLRQTLALEAASNQLNDVYNQIEDARAGGTPLAAIATQFNLTTRTVDIDANGNDINGAPIADLPVGDFLTDIFASDVGLADPPVQDGTDGLVWYDVTAITAPRTRPIEEVRDQVIAGWRADQQAQSLQALSQSVVDQLNAGATLFSIASSQNYALQTASALTRSSTPTDALSADAITAVFNGPVGYVAASATTDQSGITVLQVVNSTTPPYQPGDDADVIQNYTDQFANDLMFEFLNAVEETITIHDPNQTLVDQLAIN